MDQVVDEVKEIDYTFYENLYQSSVTVIKDAYDAPLKKIAEDLKPDAPKQYYVQNWGIFETRECR